jgi:peptidoglycan/LPS O-acetylase OafA/YrhL
VQRYELQTFHSLFPALVNIPLMIAVTMAVSALSYVIVERPFLALRSYFEPRPGSASLETYYKLAVPEIQPSAGQIGTAD